MTQWHRLTVFLTGTTVLASTAIASASTPLESDQPAQSQTTYTNPAAGDFGNVAPDPSVIRGRDGRWYLYPTVAKLPNETGRHQLPILSSTDLVNWRYEGDVFTRDENWPEWAHPDRNLWAPDIAYFDGLYHAYYTVVNSPEYETPNYAIGVATAPTPTGPWTDSGQAIVEPKWWEPFPGERRPMTTIDGDVVTAADGTRYLYYGGYQGGIFGVKLSDDGLSTVGEPQRVVSEYRLEGAYVVQRDGWYYLMGSASGCCQGPTTGYTVYAARSKDPLGPFVDADGVPLDSPRPGGTTVLANNGNMWVGVGHHAIATDVAGQDWIVYHGYDKYNPYLGPPVPHNRRLLIDRLDWIDGWPTTRAGRWGSDTPQPTPEVDALIEDAFEGGISDGWQSAAGWTTEQTAAGGHVRAAVEAEPLLAVPELPDDWRARVALRVADRTSAGLRLPGSLATARIDVRLDADLHRVTVRARSGADQARGSAALPPGADLTEWHELAVEQRNGRLTVEVSDAGQHDPVARVALDLPDGSAAERLALVADGPADFDDVTVGVAHTPVTEAVPEPEPGPLDPETSDEFDGDAISDDWTWRRELSATVTDGKLDFPLQEDGYAGTDNNAALLLRDVPQTEWMAETKLTLDFGAEKLNGFPQAGLFAYVNDDHYVRLTVVGRGDHRRTALSKEMPQDESIVFGDAWIGPPGKTTTLLRLHHSIGETTGEHLLRAGTSPDGEHWTWGAVYTLPADAEIRLGVSAFSDVGDKVAEFDYVRLYGSEG